MSIIKKEVLQVFSKEEMDQAAEAIRGGDLATIETLDVALVRNAINRVPLLIAAKMANKPSRVDTAYETWRKSLIPSSDARLKEILDTATVSSTNVTVGHGMSEDRVYLCAKTRCTWRTPLRPDGTIECSVEELTDQLSRSDYELLLTALRERQNETNT